eukprot:Awhi_evm1s2619
MAPTPHQKQVVLQYVIPTLSNTSLLKILRTSKKIKVWILQSILKLEIQAQCFTPSYNCASISSFCNLHSICFNDRGGFVPVNLSVLANLQKNIRKLKGYFIQIQNFKLLEYFPQLESLELTLCSLPEVEVLTTLYSCPNLKKLKLKHSISGLNVEVSYLQNMLKLEELSLKMQLEDYSPL